MKNNFGPWYHDRFDPGRIAKDFGDRSYTIAKVTDWAEDNEPMARLIAACPEMLEALKQVNALLAQAVDLNKVRECFPILNKAIAKAEGRES